MPQCTIILVNYFDIRREQFYIVSFVDPIGPSKPPATGVKRCILRRRRGVEGDQQRDKRAKVAARQLTPEQGRPAKSKPQPCRICRRAAFIPVHKPRALPDKILMFRFGRRVSSSSIIGTATMLSRRPAEKTGISNSVSGRVAN
jgi:hypothetical protein